MKAPPKSNKFDLILEEAQSINDFDYGQMILNYDLQARQKQIKEETIQKLKAQRSNYMSKMNQMKHERESKEKAKRKEINCKLKAKNEIIILSLKHRDLTKDEQKKQMIQSLIEKESNAKSNVDHYQQEQEAYRKRESERTQEKIMLFQERNAQMKDEIKQLFAQKMFIKEQHYRDNSLKLQMKLEENEKKIEDEAFKKYQSFYWNKKKFQESHKRYIEKNLSKTQINEERIEKVEKHLERHKSVILGKIKIMLNKSDLMAKKRSMKLESDQSERRKKLDTIKRNYSFIKEKREKYNRRILCYQSMFLNRSLEKYAQTSLNRSISQENNLREKMQDDKNEKRFLKKLEVIKSKSVLKKSPIDKYKIYKHKKKKEYQEKMRIEEETKEKEQF